MISLLLRLQCLTVLLITVSATDRPIMTFRTGSFAWGQCQIEGSYPKDLDSFNLLETTRTYSIGTTWTERCRNCSCTSFGADCRGPRCPKAYDETQEKWCLQWSEDGCCCEKLGCIVDGEKYELGSQYPYSPNNTCLTCTCEIGTSREHCLSQKCGTYEVICEGGDVTYDEKCCPHYTCPVGAVCDVIPDPFPDTPRHELKDWYGGKLDPIPLGMNQIFHLDSWNTYVCRCQRAGTAVCTMETYGGR